MNLSPIDIKSHSFKSGFRGYNKGEVDAFLNLIADEFEKQASEIKRLNAKLKESEFLYQEAKRKEAELAKLTHSVNQIKGALMQSAQKEADVMVEEAKIKATRMIQAAERKVMSLEADVKILRDRKGIVFESFRTFLDSQLQGLEKMMNRLEEEEEPSLLSPPAIERKHIEVVKVEETTRRYEAEKTARRKDIVFEEAPLVLPVLEEGPEPEIHFLRDEAKVGTGDLSITHDPPEEEIDPDTLKDVRMTPL